MLFASPLLEPPFLYMIYAWASFAVLIGAAEVLFPQFWLKLAQKMLKFIERVSNADVSRLDWMMKVSVVRLLGAALFAIGLTLLILLYMSQGSSTPEGYEDLSDKLGAERGTLYENVTVDDHFRSNTLREQERKLTEDEERALRYLISDQFLEQDDGPYLANRAGWPYCVIDGVEYELYGSGVIFLKKRSMEWLWSTPRKVYWKIDKTNRDNLDLTPLVEWYKAQVE